MGEDLEVDVNMCGLGLLCDGSDGCELPEATTEQKGCREEESLEGEEYFLEEGYLIGDQYRIVVKHPVNDEQTAKSLDDTGPVNDEQTAKSLDDTGPVNEENITEDEDVSLPICKEMQEQDTIEETSNSPQLLIDLEDTETNHIRMMDFSSDMQWICYVSQQGTNIESADTTLSVRKFTAYDDSSNKRSFIPKLNLQSNNSATIPIMAEADLNIKKYFITPDFVCKFLSISQDGLYITLSTYDESKGDDDGLCFVFHVSNTGIALCCKIKCNGRAVFLNRRNELCLAIINTESLRIYENIHTFTTSIPYKLYNLKPFEPSEENINEYKDQYEYSRHNCNWAVSIKPGLRVSPESSTISKVRDIVSLSTFIKDNILLTCTRAKKLNGSYTNDSVVRVWSLYDGLRLASIVTPGHAVIATSKDLKYLATIKSFSEGRQYVNVYNLENGCLSYRFVAYKDVRALTHAFFSHNSRYLTLSSIKHAPDGTHATLQDLNKTAMYEVWHIAEQKMICSTRKCLRDDMPRRYDLKYPYIKSLRPFVCEYMEANGEPNLKGCHVYDDKFGKLTTTKCFELDLGNEQNIVVRQDYGEVVGSLENIPLLLKAFEAEINGYNYRQDNRYEVRMYAGLFGGEAKLSSLNTYFTNDCDEHDFGSHSEYCALKRRYLDKYDDGICAKHEEIKFGDKSVLVRTGFNMIQFWESDQHTGRNNRLIYTKLFINSDNRSCYLSPNVWRIKSFESLKISGNSTNIRVVLDIIEDYQYLIPRKKYSELRSCTEDFIVYILDDDNVFNYRKFEGACQTVYYLSILYTELKGVPLSSGKSRNRQREKKYKVLFDNSMKLIVSEVKKLDGKCNAFQTIEGSKTLAMLASFQTGRAILRLLLKNEDVTINIMTYSVFTTHGYDLVNHPEESRYSLQPRKKQVVTNETPIVQSVKSSMKESVLTVLIRERSYKLYHLMFNRILNDSKNAGPECLSTLIEALFLLQELGNTNHYEKSCQKLSYLRAGKFAVLPTEIPREIPIKADYQEDLIGNIGNIAYFSALEQLQSVNFYSNLLGKYRVTIATVGSSLMVRKFRNLRKKSKITTDQFVTCVVPLPHFNTYYRTNVHDAFNDLNDPQNNPVQTWYKQKSLFLQSALDQESELNIWKQGNDNMAILLQYKWNTFIRKRFLLVCIVHLIYYISYCTGVQFAHEMYNYDFSDDERSIIASSRHVLSLTLFFASGLTLLILEYKQIPKNRNFTQYFWSGYNYVDMAAIVFPFITFLQLVLNWKYFYEISSVCTLILWLHGIVRLRVFSSFGIALETIIQLFQKVNSVLFILLLVVIGFTHSFIVLLRQQDDQYFQENYSGDTLINETTGSTTLYDLSSSNGFSDPFKAFYQVWLFIFGVWDPVTSGDAGDNRMLFVLSIIFAFITVLIFTNMIIALMSSTVDEVKQRGKRVWMTHFAAVIAEIENLTFKSTRHNRINNPAFIFYAGNEDKVKSQERKLREETLELRKLLMIDEDEQKKAAEELKSDTEGNLKTLGEFKRENDLDMKEIKNQLHELRETLALVLKQSLDTGDAAP